MTKKLKPIGSAIAEARKQIAIGSVVKKISEEFGLFEPLPTQEPVDEPEREITPVKRVQTRANDLTAIIKLARGKAVNPKDIFSVWAAMVVLAELPEGQRPPPLIGVEAGEIRYEKSAGEIGFFTKKNLVDRDRRERAKTR